MIRQSTDKTPTATGPPSSHEVLLSDGRGSTGAGRTLRLRRIVVLTVVAAVCVAGLVAFAASLVSRRIAEQEAVHDVAQLTDVLAENVVQPVLTDAMTADPGRAATVLDPLVREQLLDDSLVRVKLWDAAGTVLYSDDPRLIGKRFDLEDDALAALTSPRTQAEISDLHRPENRLDRSMGKLLEVYRPVWTPNGAALLFETYFKYDTVRARSHELGRGFAGITLTSLAALLVLLTPLVWGLVMRVRSARAEREEVASWALQASNDERQRIAATLHDGVVQQLAATSFAVAAEGQRAQASGDPLLAGRFEELAGTVRDSIAGLRSLLVDIYPPTLRTSGLAVALGDLARAINGGSARVDVELDEAAADALPESAREAVFRVAQESLRNAMRHAEADSVVLRLCEESSGTVLTVEDDGRGFDLSEILSDPPQGHFGLHLMADAAARCGARLAIASSPGRGTSLRMTMAHV